MLLLQPAARASQSGPVTLPAEENALASVADACPRLLTCCLSAPAVIKRITSSLWMSSTATYRWQKQSPGGVGSCSKGEGDVWHFRVVS